MVDTSTFPRRMTAEGRVPIPAPSWAVRTVREGGGVAHESGTRVVPDAIRDVDLYVNELTTAEISVSVIDARVDGRWERLSPTVDIQGGSYTLDGARSLCAAIGDLLNATVTETSA